MAIHPGCHQTMTDSDEKTDRQGTRIDVPGTTASRDGEESGAALDLKRLNRMLSRLAGSDFRIALFVGEEVTQMDEATLTAMAACYARLARERWYENWTTASAREELKNYFSADEQRINLVSLVFKGEEVVGLCWAFMFSASNPGNLGAHFSSSKLSNKSNLETVTDWITQVGGKEKLVSIRELGVLRQYRKIRAPLLCAPVFARAQTFGCKYIFLRTPVSNKSLKWSLGMGFVPVHYFVVNQMLLMLGDLAHTMKDYEFRILDYFAGQLAEILDQDRDFEALMHQAELNYAEKMNVMQSLSANIAHEMRTPLSGVRASMAGMEEYLPILLEVYRNASKDNPEAVPAIREDHLGILASTPERISLMIDQANSVIDMLLMNLRDNTVDKRQFGIYSAAACINQALDRYPFKRGERDSLVLDLEDDFYFRGLDNLFIYVIFNLLKNALYSIKSALKGEVTITLTAGKGINKLVFRDTGEGMPAEVVGKVFDGFFSTREEGTGVGLAFCQRTIRSFDGDIACASEVGEYAEFTITLPAV